MSHQSFEESYFNQAYQGNYLLRNPDYKWKAYLHQILRYRQNGSLLDVGCALGLFLALAYRHFDCTGVDVSIYALEFARKRLPSTVSLHRGSLGELTTSHRYDVITCFDVIEHITDLSHVWANLNYLLKPEGLLVISVPVYDGPLGWLVNCLDHDSTHIHRRERTFWLDQVQANFRLLDYMGIWRFFFFGRFYLNVISSRTRSITSAILLISEKE